VLTTDDYRIRVQPVALTTKKADRSQEKAIRRVMIDKVHAAAEDRTFESFVDAIVEGNLSSAIYGDAKLIYPLRRVEIQKLTLEARPSEVAAEEEICRRRRRRRSGWCRRRRVTPSPSVPAVFPFSQSRSGGAATRCWE